MTTLEFSILLQLRARLRRIEMLITEQKTAQDADPADSYATGYLAALWHERIFVTDLMAEIKKSKRVL